MSERTATCVRVRYFRYNPSKSQWSVSILRVSAAVSHCSSTPSICYCQKKKLIIEIFYHHAPDAQRRAEQSFPFLLTPFVSFALRCVVWMPVAYYVELSLPSELC
jgi:hypothetical protein